jgi:hypothetical protein
VEIILAEICSKKYSHELKSYTTEVSEVFMAFSHTKKVDIWSFIKARIRIRPQISGSGHRFLDPDPTKKVRIRPDPDLQHWQKLEKPI